MSNLLRKPVVCLQHISLQSMLRNINIQLVSSLQECTNICLFSKSARLTDKRLSKLWSVLAFASKSTSPRGLIGVLKWGTACQWCHNAFFLQPSESKSSFSAVNLYKTKLPSIYFQLIVLYEGDQGCKIVSANLHTG